VHEGGENLVDGGFIEMSKKPRPAGHCAVKNPNTQLTMSQPANILFKSKLDE
jgi:hypothetical protein